MANTFCPPSIAPGVDPDPAVLPRFAARLAKADALTLAATDREGSGHAHLKEMRARVLPELEKLLALTRFRCRRPEPELPSGS